MRKQPRTKGWALWCLAVRVVLTGPRLAVVYAAPAHPRLFLMPPAEKARLLKRTRSNESARTQYEAICFAVDRPHKARFNGASIRISARPGDPLWFGLVRPDRLDPWRQSRIKK